MSYRGDYDASTVIYGKFTTFRPSTGAPFTLAGTPALSVYKDNSVTQSTTGVTLTVDFDAVTGLNHFAIDTSADGTFYSAGSNFDIVITAGTVDSVSVVGSVVASFTIRKDSALKPTTAGRTLDVSAGGEAGLDWANIGSPTTAQNLSATNIDVDQVVASVSGAVGSVTGAVGSVTGNVGGNVVGSVGSVALDGITSSSLAASAITEIQSGLATSAALATVQADTDDIQTRLPAALVAGRMDASVGAMATDTLTAAALAASAVTEIQAGLSTLDAAGVRAAVGLAAANLDTQIADLPTNAELAARTLAAADYSTAAAVDALPTATENADALLNRDMSLVSDTVARSPLNALRFIRNKWDVAGGTLTVKKEDDLTTAWTAAVSTSAGAEPIVGNDPA